MSPTRTLTARVDPGLRATLDHLTPLTLAAAPPPADDHPAHVRAASAIRRWGPRLVLVQDDVNALTLRDPTGHVRPLLLPPGPDNRRVFGDDLGNKHHKMDLEACAVLPDGRCVAFGSGSTPRRERLVALTPDAPPRLVDGAALYAHLRATEAFAGSELNIEGALVAGHALLLFQRGNGAPRGALAPINAMGSLDLEAFTRWLDGKAPAPTLQAITRLHLGALDGIPLGVTDATLAPDGRVAIITTAEASPDATRDGPVAGGRFGYLDDTALVVTDILDPTGRLAPLKLEGIERRPDAWGEYDVVADTDRPDQPATLGRLRVTDA